MAYGTEVSNSSGRVQFSTEEPYSVASAGTATTLTGYSATIPTYASGEFLVCRPPDNVSGVIAWDEADGKFLGANTYLQTFGASNGVKYRKCSTVNSLATPGTGYGIDVFASNGTTCIFTSNVGRTMELVYFTELSQTNDWITYKNPSGQNFNELYVTALELRINYVAGSAGFVDKIITGAWAYFDDTNELIEVRAASLRVPSTQLSTQMYWNSIPYVDTNIYQGSALYSGAGVLRKGICIFRCIGV